MEETKLTFDNPQDNNEGGDECYNSLEEYFVDCARYGDLAEVKGCIEEEVDINWFDDNLNTALHMAAANGHVDVIKEILNVKKDDKIVANLNARNSDGCTPLHWAVINNQKAAIELLIEKGADCNIKNKFGKSPLDEAIEVENYELGEILAKNTKPDEEELKEPEPEEGQEGQDEGEEADDEEEEIESSDKKEK